MNVPYLGGYMARDMVARTLTSTGTRASGRPVASRAGPDPVALARLGFLADTHRPATVSYEAAKRTRLGSLGAAGSGYQFQTGVGAGSGAASGAATGASVGSVIPVVGTVVGAVVGAVIGAIAGSIGKKDPEDADFTRASQIYNYQGVQGVLNISNKYLVLAGLFDLHPGQIKGNIPIYKKFGRMGEQAFVNALCNLLYAAGQAGKISPTDTILAVKQRIVDPWIASFGYGQMADSNAGMIDAIILGMTAEYLMGGQGLWLDVNGGTPFRSLPNFTLPKAAAPPPPVAVAPPVTPSGAVLPMVSAPVVIPSVSTPSNPNQPALIVSPPQQMTIQPVAPPPMQPAIVPVTSNAAAATPPTNYSVVGTDTTGQPVFSSPAGVLYQWDGTAMHYFSGQLASNTGLGAQMQQAIQSALAQGTPPAQAAQAGIATAQAAGVPITPDLQSQANAQTAATASAPQMVAAGMGLDGGNMGVFAAIAAVALFAIPMGQPKVRSRAVRNR